jgi:uncharacterized membrane protein YsdA (DUF1294 family)
MTIDALVQQLRSWPMPALLLLAYAALALVSSALAIIAYARDKAAARRGQHRIPEASLHRLELLGGWPGALLAQRLLRHKNAKGSYQRVFWLIISLHALLLVGLGYWLWRG